MNSNQELVDHLKMHGLLVNELLERAFLSIDRKDFVKEESKDFAYEDIPFPIGFGQTISQPATVATMLELLEPEEGQKILDIGYGSGYSTALLASAIGLGKIFAFEINPEIALWGRNNINKYNFINDELVVPITGDGSVGLPSEAPFDRIIASAGSDVIPEELLYQLKVGGILVIPSRSSLVKIKRTSETNFESGELPGFVFVPLVQSK
jgi:protein-L-isoaspartate(D-aspartate) O-methyltransferase